jgi:hypothetical protein
MVLQPTHDRFTAHRLLFTEGFALGALHFGLVQIQIALKGFFIETALPSTDLQSCCSLVSPSSRAHPQP